MFLGGFICFLGTLEHFREYFLILRPHGIDLTLWFTRPSQGYISTQIQAMTTARNQVASDLHIFVMFCLLTIFSSSFVPIKCKPQFAFHRQKCRFSHGVLDHKINKIKGTKKKMQKLNEFSQFNVYFEFWFQFLHKSRISFYPRIIDVYLKTNTKTKKKIKQRKRVNKTKK